jgi:hypothetical protein
MADMSITIKKRKHKIDKTVIRHLLERCIILFLFSILIQ